MQTECRTTSLLDCYAEVQLILCKDNDLSLRNIVIRKILFIVQFTTGYLGIVNRLLWHCKQATCVSQVIWKKTNSNKKTNNNNEKKNNNNKKRWGDKLDFTVKVLPSPPYGKNFIKGFHQKHFHKCQ